MTLCQISVYKGLNIRSKHDIGRRKYLGGGIKGQQRQRMGAHDRGDIDDKPSPPMREQISDD